MFQRFKIKSEPQQVTKTYTMAAEKENNCTLSYHKQFHNMYART
jgi:hypothetical protein